MKYTLYFIGLFLLSTLTLNGQKRKMPEWVISTPVDDQSYYGVGISSMEENLNYREEARKKALLEIAEKIFVTIDSESNLTVSYRNEASSYLLEEDINTRTSNFLKGYEKVDDWVDHKKDTYYVLFKLDQKTHEFNRSAYIDRFINSIQDLEDRAIELFLKTEYKTAFGYLENGISLCEEELSNYLEPEFAYRISEKQNELVSIYEDHLSRIKMVTDTEEVVFDPMSHGPTRYSFRVEDKLTGKNLEGLPIVLETLSGDVFNYEIHSDAESYYLELLGVLPDEGEAVIRIRPGLMGSNVGSRPTLKSLVKKLETRTIRIIFEPVFVQIQFSQDTEEIVRSRFGKFLENYLRFCSVVYSPEPSSTDLLVRLDLPYEKFRKSAGDYLSRLNGEILITTPEEEVLYRILLPVADGDGRSITGSDYAAVNELIRNIDPVLNSMTQYFCGYKAGISAD